MPFAGYTGWDACIRDQLRQGKSEESAKKICGALESKLAPKKKKIKIKRKSRSKKK